MRLLTTFFLIFIPVTLALHVWTVSAGLSLVTAGALMWSVGGSALLAILITRSPWSVIGWRLGKLKYWLIAIFLPLVYGLIAYGGAAALGLAGFGGMEELTVYATAVTKGDTFTLTGLATTLGLVLTVNLAIGFFLATGEEIGWRGLLTPKLTEATGFIAATLIVGALWALWHFPILLFGDYHAGGEPWAEAASFFVMVVAISGAFAWLRLASGSVWPAAVLHATHNCFLQSVFDPLSSRAESSITMVGEFGVVTAIVCVLVCAPFWIAGMRWEGENGPNSGPA